MALAVFIALCVNIFAVICYLIVSNLGSLTHLTNSPPFFFPFSPSSLTPYPLPPPSTLPSPPAFHLTLSPQPSLHTPTLFLALHPPTHSPDEPSGLLQSCSQVWSPRIPSWEAVWPWGLWQWCGATMQDSSNRKSQNPPAGHSLWCFSSLKISVATTLLV